MNKWKPGENPPFLDAMLTREQAAAWLQMPVDELAKKSRGSNKTIPQFRPGHKTVRCHPRTIIAVMARDAGVPMAIIAASMNLERLQ